MKNETGQIAIKRYNSNPSTEVCPNGHTYSFTPNFGVSIGWVNEEDLPYILGIKYNACSCSNGNKASKYTVASENAFKVWKTGSY